MQELTILLFGRIEITDRHSIVVKSRKALAPLTFLAIAQQAHSHNRLATLLWSDSDETRAGNSLSRVRYYLNQKPLGKHLTWATLQLNIGQFLVDVNRFGILIDRRHS
jgi:DNA-binding SARP family transcriptional activator